MYFDSNIIGLNLWWCNWQKVNIDWYNGCVPNRCQTIIWTNADLYMHHSALMINYAKFAFFCYFLLHIINA